MKVRQF